MSPSDRARYSVSMPRGAMEWRDDKSPKSRAVPGVRALRRGSLCYSPAAFAIASPFRGDGMAQDHQHGSDHSTGGSMDIQDHVKTWLAFWAGVKWSVMILVILAVLLFLFRTHNG